MGVSHSAEPDENEECPTIASIRGSAYICGRMKNAILISGIPGCGKSTFGRWMESAHGYRHVDMEHGGLDRDGLHKVWDDYHSGSDTVSFPRALSTFKVPVILDWGFPVEFLPVVDRMKSGGVNLWWFDGARSAARELFCQRKTVPVENFDRQVASISAHWDKIAAVFAGRIIKILSPDGSRLSHEVIYDTIK